MEIQRISEATDFNGIKLLDGSMSADHEGSALNSSGAAKIHFGTGNDSAEDYYYVNIGNSSLEGLTLGTTIPDSIQRINDRATNGEWNLGITSGVVPYAYIPKGSRNVTIQIDAHPDRLPILADDDDIALFTRDGHHIAGSPAGPDPNTAIPGSNDQAWSANGINSGNINQNFINASNGFYDDAVYDSSSINNGGGAYSGSSATRTASFRGMNLAYGGDGDWFDSTPNAPSNDAGTTVEYLNIDEATEDLLLFSVGIGQFAMRVSWDVMTDVDYSNVDGMQVIDIREQEGAQSALEQIDRAIVVKDKIRADLGATQNRLENTVTNLSIQAENLQVSESRISDVDVASEMTEFVRRQILTQAAVSMLAQANSLPKMAMQIMGA